jgi:predicted nucleotidyltransferase
MNVSTSILLDKIRYVLSNEPVNRAWLFGSYARGQETSSSDIDILVEMAPNDLTMLGFLKIQTKLEKATKRPVDLIEDECLEDFARESAEKDKILFYEAV